MKKKFLISGLTLFAGALAFTLISSNTCNQNDSVLFVDSDNIAQAYFFGGCIQSSGGICNGMPNWRWVATGGNQLKN